ncbi:Uma2 family endonuclease [Altericista sp. CCNU0014]|uniref:Uma2 family endonuclease n=1 Tax=Altericista sp. CCNU0014 TaxID=3082949 RepID=UPI00384FE052
MLSAETKFFSFEEFLAWNDGRSDTKFELRQGIPMPVVEPNANHEDVIAMLCMYLINFCQASDLPYVPRQNKQIRLKLDANQRESSRYGDIVVFAQDEWQRMKQLGISAAAYIPPPLVIEVVSTNWRDDYRTKVDEYEALGVAEYWIVDYAGLGGMQYIGMPKQPTLTVLESIDGEYRQQLFRGSDRIISPTFPTLALTAAEVFAFGG